MMLEGQTFQKVECEKKTNFNKRKIKKSTCTTSQKKMQKRQLVQKEGHMCQVEPPSLDNDLQRSFQIHFAAIHTY